MLMGEAPVEMSWLSLTGVIRLIGTSCRWEETGLVEAGVRGFGGRLDIVVEEGRCRGFSGQGRVVSVY